MRYLLLCFLSKPTNKGSLKDLIFFSFNQSPLKKKALALRQQIPGFLLV